MSDKTAQIRCQWCEKDELYRNYHDNEWGRTGKSENELFELLCLECFQAGLSWHLVLKRRQALNKAFLGFIPHEVASFIQGDVERILSTPDVIKSRPKILACINNASKFIAVQNEFGSFWSYILSFVGGKPIKYRPNELSQIHSHSTHSHALARDAKKRGFKFLGPVIAHSFLQASGAIDEHLSYCFLAK